MTVYLQYELFEIAEYLWIWIVKQIWLASSSRTHTVMWILHFFQKPRTNTRRRECSPPCSYSNQCAFWVRKSLFSMQVWGRKYFSLLYDSLRTSNALWFLNYYHPCILASHGVPMKSTFVKSEYFKIHRHISLIGWITFRARSIILSRPIIMPVYSMWEVFHQAIKTI